MSPTYHPHHHAGPQAGVAEGTEPEGCQDAVGCSVPLFLWVPSLRRGHLPIRDGVRPGVSSGILGCGGRQQGHSHSTSGHHQGLQDRPVSAGSHPPHRCVRGASVPGGCSTELRGGEGEFSRSLVPLGGWQVPDTGPVCGEYANCSHSGRIQGQGLCGPQFSHWCGYHGGPAGYTRFADQDSWPLGEQRLYPLH